MKDNPLLLETIRLQDGRLFFLSDHQRRLEESRRCYFGDDAEISLKKAIKIPQEQREGIYKVRVEYGATIEAMEITSYTIRPVEALQLIEVNDLDYNHKYADRQALQSLFDRRTYGDDILMVRNGLLTDTSYANVALFDGLKWYTPAEPLLPGTARARLLDQGLLQPADIAPSALSGFKEIRLINAMMDWEEGPRVGAERVRW